jgi:hypothetical protein
VVVVVGHRVVRVCLCVESLEGMVVSIFSFQFFLLRA